MTKKKDSKVDQDNLSELEEVQDSIEQPEEESDLEEEVEPSAEEKISSLEDQMMRLQAEDGIRDYQRSRGLGDVYKRQPIDLANSSCFSSMI